LIGVAYTLRAVIKAFFAEDSEQPVSKSALLAIPISIPERAGAVMLLGTTLLIGLCPSLLLDLITPALHSPLMQSLIKGVGR